jgi:hypothetical protein
MLESLFLSLSFYNIYQQTIFFLLARVYISSSISYLWMSCPTLWVIKIQVVYIISPRTCQAYGYIANNSYLGIYV